MSTDALEPEGDAATPRLSISCSSPEGGAALRIHAARILARMDPELAELLARTVVVLALDKEQHAGFAQRLGRPGDVTTRLAQEQVRQGGRRPNDVMTLIVMQLYRPLNREHNALLLAHELGHAALGHTIDYDRVAALGQDSIDAMEREADAFARLYVYGEATESSTNSDTSSMVHDEVGPPP